MAVEESATAWRRDGTMLLLLSDMWIEGARCYSSVDFVKGDGCIIGIGNSLLKFDGPLSTAATMRVNKCNQCENIY